MLCCLFVAFTLDFWSKIEQKIVEKIDFQNFFKIIFSKICSEGSLNIDQIQLFLRPETPQNRTPSKIKGPNVKLLWDWKLTIWLQSVIYGVRVIFWVPWCCFSKSSCNLQHFSYISHLHTMSRKKVIEAWNLRWDH